MRCPNHLLREAVGYCKVCGAFGCADCVTFHEGEYYCKRDFKPIQDEIDRKVKHEQQRVRPERQRLVVHTKSGETFNGVCFAMNLEHESFKLELMDERGEPLSKTQTFLFKDLKAIFYVRSFDGDFDRSRAITEMYQKGASVVVEFLDGEIIKGHTHQAYHNEAPRFHMIPEDADGNNINVMVERSAVKAVYTPHEFHEIKKRELQDYVDAHLAPGKDPEEVIGDYYHAKKDARRALSHYTKAVEHVGETPALLKKLVVSEYNTAMHYIREKHLTHALQHLEKARKLDADNEHVLQRIAQIRKKLNLDRTAGRTSA